MNALQHIGESLQEIRRRLAVAATTVGRAPGDIALVAVAKTHPAEAVEAALAAGQTVFGENRVQEAAAKYPPLRAQHPDLVLHLIGPLQTNKVKEAVQLFDAIETVDREKLARSLAAEMVRQDKRPLLYVQVNIGEESQKAGVPPREADAFIRLCRDEFGLSLAGLMCIPPAGVPPAPYFALLREIATRNGIAGLSMGMSEDFEMAVRLGATLVRVGSAIFGARPPLPAPPEKV
jgi:PLP dependent protein